MTNEQLWAIYAQGISQAAGLTANPSNFILTGTPMIANLAATSVALNERPTVNEALYQIYSIANTEVALQGIYTPSMMNFFSDYATYIDNLIPVGNQITPTPTQSAQIKMLQSRIVEGNKQLNRVYVAATKAWKLQSEIFPGKYPTFQTFVNQTTWVTTINTDNNILSGYNSQLSTLLATIYGKEYVAIQQAKITVDDIRRAILGVSNVGPQTMVVKAEAGDVIVPTYNPSSLLEFSTWVDETIAQHGQAKPIHIDFTEAAAQFDFSKSTYFTHTDFHTNYFFYSVDGITGTKSREVNVNPTANFKIDFQFDAITKLDIKKGAWYDSNLMKSFPNPNNLAVPTDLIIGMYPRVTMTMDSASYATAFSSYNSESGFGFGPFWVSASHKTNRSNLPMTAKWDSVSNTVTIESTSVKPVVLGMQVAPIGEFTVNSLITKVAKKAVASVN